MPPTLDQRLDLRFRPNGFAFIRQRWSQLLFLRWRIDPAILTPKLPLGLHEDEAYLGIVPFFMASFRA